MYFLPFFSFFPFFFSSFFPFFFFYFYPFIFIFIPFFHIFFYHMQVLWAQGWRMAWSRSQPASKKRDKSLFPLLWLPGQQQEKGIHGSKAGNSVEVELSLQPAWVVLSILDLFCTPGCEFFLVFPWNEWEQSGEDSLESGRIQALLPRSIGSFGSWNWGWAVWGF